MGFVAKIKENNRTHVVSKEELPFEEERKKKIVLKAEQYWRKLEKRKS